MIKKPYIVYSPALDKFVKIRKFGEEDFTSLIESLDAKVNLEKFRISQYVEFVVSEVVVGYNKLRKDYEEHALTEILFDCVVEVYPVFSVDIVCRTINSAEEDETTGKINDISASTMKDILKIRKNIEGNLFGQTEAVDAVVKNLKLLGSGLESFISMFFIGPTGVGKTELSRLLATHYLKDQKKLIKINCAEYSSPHEYAKLIGSPPGYIGHNEKGLLSAKAEESDQYVILFDEVEKANSKLHDLLLSLLDDGTICDSSGKELDFKKSMFIFTSNVGLRDNMGKKSLGFGAEKFSYSDIRGSIEDEFNRVFAPEFRNRIDDVIHFNSLDKETAERIADFNLKKLPIKVTKKLVSYVVDNSFSEEYGARNIKRFIKNNVSVKIAERILEGDKKSKYKPIFCKGELTGVSSL